MTSDIFSPALPLPVGLGLTLLMAVLLLAVLQRVPDWATRYLLSAIFLRSILSAFPDYSLKSVAGLSIAALVSISIVGGGLLLIPVRRFLTKAMLPVYAMLIVVVVSSLASGRITDGIDTMLKWLYFGVLVLLVILAGERHGIVRLANFLIPAFLPPIVFQMASVALGVSKASEADGSVSYIGGYFHESGMATALLGLLFVTSLARLAVPLLKPALLVAASAGLVLANYRTALMAAAPIAMAAMTAVSVRAFSPRQRMLVTIMVIPVAILAFTSVASTMAERMADIGPALARWEMVLQPPGAFTEEERRLMSGRVYIWAQYIDTYSRGSEMQLLFGRGPDAYNDFFALYAHNTLIGYLFDFGVLGVLGIVGVWTYFLSRAVLTRGDLRVELIAGHLGFLILNMATMPHWLIEGNIFYAMVCGFSVLAYRRSVAFGARTGGPWPAAHHHPWPSHPRPVGARFGHVGRPTRTR
jgi:hypothetical protein